MDAGNVSQSFDSALDAAAESGEAVHLVLPVGTPMALMIQAQTTFLNLLREVSKSVAGTVDDPVDWVVDRVSESSADYALIPKPLVQTVRPQDLHVMVEAVPNGLRALKSGAERPRYFTERALELTTVLTRVLPASAPAIRTRNGAGEVEITQAAATHARRILDQPYVSEFGTVEGRLETVNVHGRREFVIYDEVTGARIECKFGHRVATETIGAAIERRVAVTGEIRSREWGEIISVVVARDGFEVIPTDDELPTTEDVLGILAN